MLSTIPVQWLSEFVLPLTACAISLLTWRLMARRGWNRVLPVLSLYVIFSSLTSVILLTLSVLQRYADGLQPTFCRVYAGDSQIISLSTPLLLAVAIIELTKHISGQNAAARRIYTVAVTIGMVSILTVDASLIAIRGSTPAANLIDRAFAWATLITILVTIVLAFRFFTIKHRHKPEGNLGLLGIVIGSYGFLDLVWYFVVASGRGATESGTILEQILWLAHVILLYWALAWKPRAQGAFVPSQQ